MGKAKQCHLEEWEKYFKVVEDRTYHNNYDKRKVQYNKFLPAIYQVWFHYNENKTILMSQHGTLPMARAFARSYMKQIDMILVGAI